MLLAITPSLAQPRVPRPADLRLALGGQEQPGPSTVGKLDPKADFTVAIFGDSFGADVARGLDDAPERDDTALLDATGSGSTGLVQTPIATWAAAIEGAKAKAGAIDVAVVMLGSADSGPLTDDEGRRVERGSAEWRAAYGRRVQQLAELFKSRRIPLIWVGLPIVRDPATASRFADLNSIIRERAVAGGAIFEDIWDVFVDDNGDYSPNGPDVDGQPARLRRNDGSGFMRAGARKLASFLDADLKSERQRATASRRLAAVAVENRSVFDEALQIDINAQIRREAGLSGGSAVAPTSSAAPKPGPVILLTAAPNSPGGRLAGPDDRTALLGLTEASRGITPPAQPGRTDDFAWPRP